MLSFLLKILSCFLFLSVLFAQTCSASLLPEFFNTETSKSRLLISDPQQAMFRTLFVYSADGAFKGKKFLDLEFGSDLPFFRLIDDTGSNSKEILSINVRGAVYSRFNFFSKSFNLYGMNYFGGLSLLYKAPWKANNEFELYVYHESSHLGDDYLQNNPGAYAFNYSAESVRLLHYLDLFNLCQLAYGGQYAVRKDTALKIGRLTLQGNLTIPLKLSFVNAFFSADFKSRETNKWNPEYNMQFGISLSGTESLLNDFHHAQSLVIEYYNGFSNLGQFYTKREQSFSVGIAARL